MKTCRHCGKAKVSRPRGLCWVCYYAPGVKELYPSKSKYASRGVGNICRNARLPAEATDARPGSKEKIAVLAARAERGECLHHPADAKGGARLAGNGGARLFRCLIAAAGGGRVVRRKALLSLEEAA